MGMMHGLSRFPGQLRSHSVRLYTKYLSDVIFVHINKTAGSSIEAALGLPFQHRTAREIRSDIGERRWLRRFSFAFVRNPWDKVASQYQYRIRMNATDLASRPVDFDTWVRLTYGEKALPYYDKPKMFMPQLDWIGDEEGRILVNFVGRFENLTEDFHHVCRELGRDATLPHLKRSASGDYRRLYGSNAAEIVAHWFEKDIAAFGYRFDP
jgi:hypothetical protein